MGLENAVFDEKYSQRVMCGEHVENGSSVVRIRRAGRTGPVKFAEGNCVEVEEFGVGRIGKKVGICRGRPSMMC